LSGATAVSVPPDVRCQAHCFSACRLRGQGCAELLVEGVAQGVFTWTWIKALVSSHLRPTLNQHSDALVNIMDSMKCHHTFLDQDPVLHLGSSSKLVDGLVCTGDVRTSPGTAIQCPLTPQSHRRKALLIGINYMGSHAQLKGCVNDAWSMHSMLRSTMQYTDDQIRMLTDGDDGQPQRPELVPTKANIIAGLQWLAAGVKPGDQLLLLFCGYGAQHPTVNGGGMHESYLVPSDFAVDLPPDFFAAGASTTSLPVRNSGRKAYRLLPLLEVTNFLVQIPAAVRLTLILDCSYANVPGVDPSQTVAVAFPKVERGRVDYAKLRDYVGRPRFLELPPITGVEHSSSSLRAINKYPDSHVHCFSACKLQECAFELPVEGTVQGAFTWAFIKAVAAGDFNCSLNSLQQRLSKTASDLKLHFRGVEQTPVLQVSKSAGMDDTVFGSS